MGQPDEGNAFKKHSRVFWVVVWGALDEGKPMLFLPCLLELLDLQVGGAVTDNLSSQLRNP